MSKKYLRLLASAYEWLTNAQSTSKAFPICKSNEHWTRQVRSKTELDCNLWTRIEQQQQQVQQQCCSEVSQITKLFDRGTNNCMIICYIPPRETVCLYSTYRRSKYCATGLLIACYHHEYLQHYLIRLFVGLLFLCKFRLKRKKENVTLLPVIRIPKIRRLRL